MSAINIKTALSLAALATTALPLTSAYAWHPEGQITKYVRNVTAGTDYSDANTTSTAVAAKPGDKLMYKIVVKNPAKPANNQWNDLYFLKITDKLPTGIVGADVSKGYDAPILPGKSVEHTFEVTVADNADGTIKNTACFTGDSKVKDRPLKGCDDAIIKVTQPVKPQPPVTPELPKTPETPVEPEGKGGAAPAPVTLPETGPGAALAAIAGIGSMGYAGRAYLTSRRNLTKAIKTNR